MIQERSLTRETKFSKTKLDVALVLDPFFQHHRGGSVQLSSNFQCNPLNIMSSQKSLIHRFKKFSVFTRFCVTGEEMKVEKYVLGSPKPFR